MRKNILLACFLTVFIILVLPSINAIEFYEIKKTSESILSSRSYYFDILLGKYDLFISKNVGGIFFIMLSLGFLVIADVLSVLGWMLLVAWDSSMGLGVAIIFSSGVGMAISLFFLFLSCLSNQGSIALIIPFIIALSPVYLPVLIWSLSLSFL